jgi:hypothetical protein
MKAKQGQSFSDLVIQGTGNIENSFAMAVLNGLSITDSLFIGQEIVPAGNENKFMLSQWNEYNLPATATTSENQELLIRNDGIGIMAIGNTFIVR